MPRKEIVPMILIPFKVNEGIDGTVRSMISGLEAATKEDEDLHMDYLHVKGRPTLNMILTNWAITATACDEWESRLKARQCEYATAYEKHYQNMEQEIRKKLEEEYSEKLEQAYAKFAEERSGHESTE